MARILRERDELRAKIERFTQIDDERCKIVDELRAEIERLRAALQAFISGIDNEAWYPPEHWMSPLREAALAALDRN